MAGRWVGRQEIVKIFGAERLFEGHLVRKETVHSDRSIGSENGWRRAGFGCKEGTGTPAMWRRGPRAGAGLCGQSDYGL